jgi:outer membrane lipoprotein-sorting protein
MLLELSPGKWRISVNCWKPAFPDEIAVGFRSCDAAAFRCRLEFGTLPDAPCAEEKMKLSFRNRVATWSAFATVMVLLIVIANAQSGNQAANSTPKTTEQAFKNIRVMKGLPADQLIPSMQFITAALGVECGFCHVEGAFDKDDKETKQTARKMIQMMMVINEDNFDGHRVVTCNTCHRGNSKPAGIPAIAEANAPAPAESANKEAAKLPTADALVDKYIQATGGAAAIQKVSSRVEKGTMSAQGQQFPIEIYAKAPDKRVSFAHLPNGGDSITAFDGESGWLGSPGRPVREMHSGDIEVARLDADLHFPTRIKQIFKELKTDSTEKVGDRETYVVTGTRDGQPPVHLYFDQQSGLLVRMVRYVDSPLGLNPSQVDYADYHDAGGAKIPYRWTLARPSGSFTIQVQDVQQNVPVDDAKFNRPADAPPAAPKTK